MSIFHLCPYRSPPPVLSIPVLNHFSHFCPSLYSLPQGFSVCYPECQWARPCCHCVVDFCCAPLLVSLPSTFILSICHPSIFLCPSSHSLNHPPPYHPSRFINTFVYLAVRHQFRPPSVIRPSIQLSITLEGPCFILFLSLGLPFPYAPSCLIPGLPVRLALSLIPSPCLPPPSPDSVAALQSGLPPPSGHLRPSPSRPGPPHTRLGQTHQHPG